MNKNARRCVFFVQSVKYEKLDFTLWCKNVYSYFKKRCQKQTSHKPRPQGSMGSFKSVFIAAVKRELKKPRRRRRGQRLKNELIFYIRIS